MTGRIHEVMAELHEQSSMDYWFPRLQDTDVPYPKTVSLPTEEEEIEDSSEAEGGFTVRRPDTDAVIDAIHEVGGPPAFIRTDQASAKHRMKRASHVPDDDEKTVGSHVWEVIEFNEMAGFLGLPYKTFYVRQWLDLWHHYEAFGGAAIAAEIRWYIQHGEVYDRAFYWPEDAIASALSHATEPPDNWRELHEATRHHAFEHAEAVEENWLPGVAEAFPQDYWSVDFALTSDDGWFLLDMARGEISWHPPDMEQATPDPRGVPLE